jgi:predicted amidohydrolase
MKEELIISGFQMDLAWENRELNFLKIEKMIGAMSESPDLIILPEMFTSGFTMNTAAVAESFDEAKMKSLVWMKNMARQTGAVLVGSVPLNDLSGYYNRLLWVEPSGRVLTYDKRHTFAYAGEDQYYRRGTERMIGTMKGWKILPLICYDLRFPVWSRNGFINGEIEYDVLLYVANWPSVRAHAWNSLLVARAIENQCYTIGVNRTGKDGNGHAYKGDSVILDYKGETITKLGEEEKVLTAKLNWEELQSFRVKYPFLSDADAFQLIS